MTDKTTLWLDELVKAGDLTNYDRYHGPSGDDLLYLVFPSGLELHVAASIVEGQSNLRVEAKEKLSWEGLSARDFYAYLAALKGVSRERAKLAFLQWYHAERPGKS